MSQDFFALSNTLLNNYIFLDLLGKTKLSAVYAGKNRTTKEAVAIKVLRSDVYVSREDEKRRIRFEREAIMGAKFRHPSIVPILDYFTHENLSCIVMHLYPDGTLGDLIESKGHLSLAETARYLQEIASALDYAHSHSVVHRDIKPDNMLLDENGHLMLSDFGIARITDNPNWRTLTTQSDMCMGTVPYMSPEACRGTGVDWRTDIYAFGIVLYEMLHGNTPFNKSASTREIIEWHEDEHTVLPSLHQQHPEIPSSVDRVLRRATAKHREDRFPSTQALAEAFASSIVSHAPYNAATEIDQDVFFDKAPAYNRAARPAFAARRFAENFDSQEDRRDTALRRAKQYVSILTAKSPTTWLWLIGILLIVSASGSLFLFARPSPAPTLKFATNGMSVVSDVQQAQDSIYAYYDDWNKGNYQAAYNLLSLDYQKDHLYTQELANYKQVHYSCYILNNPQTLSDGSIQVDVTVNQIRNNETGAGNVVYEYTLSFIAQNIQGIWRLMAENVRLISMQGTCHT